MFFFQNTLDVSKLAREIEILKEYIHINELLIDLTLEHRRVVNVIGNTQLPNFEKELLDRNKDLLKQLHERKDVLRQFIVTFL